MSYSVPEPKKEQTLKSGGLRRLLDQIDPNYKPSMLEQALVRGAFRKALSLGDEDFRLALKIAADHLLRGDLGAALQIYIGLVLCEPINAEFQLGLANCALQIGEYHLALQAASALIAMEPDDFRGYYISGRASMALKARDDAEEDLKQAAVLATGPQAASIREEIQGLLRKLEVLKKIST